MELKIDTTLAHTIAQTEYEARYDKAAKKLLADRLVLAHILKGCVSEYGDLDIFDISDKYIEGEPQIGMVGVDMDDTNVGKKHETKAAGLNNEEYIRLIINVEAQNRFRPQYPLTKRAVYYCSRLISAQQGTVFTNSEYGKLRKVYSIWICVNPAKDFKNTITRYSFQPENIVGNAVEKKENYDMISIVMVCLGDMDDRGEPDLLKFLGILFHEELSADEKKDILKREFDIPMTETFESEVREMCNLSEGVLEKGIQRGMEQGREITLVELVNDGTISLEEVAKKAGLTADEFREVMKRRNTCSQG